MTPATKSYSLFYKFIETYSPLSFSGFNSDDPLMKELEEMTEKNNQFFFIADIVLMKIIYSSNRSMQMIGIPPDELTPYHIRESVHPDDAMRFGRGNTQLFKIVNELYNKRNGTALLSTNIRIRNPLGYYSDLLFQCYLFYSSIPYNTVHLLQVHTNISWHKKNKHSCHYYLGNDLSNFRYPDEELLKIGIILSSREFEIISMIESGMNSEQIAARLFLSFHTINTHRSNVLNKTGFKSILELIIDFQKRGLM